VAELDELPAPVASADSMAQCLRYLTRDETRNLQIADSCAAAGSAAVRGTDLCIAYAVAKAHCGKWRGADTGMVACPTNTAQRFDEDSAPIAMCSNATTSISGRPTTDLMF
jgi:hypothetical protein